MTNSKQVNPAVTTKEAFTIDSLVACGLWPYHNCDFSVNTAWSSYSGKMCTVFDHFLTASIVRQYSVNLDEAVNNPVFGNDALGAIVNRLRTRSESLLTNRQIYQNAKRKIVQEISIELQKEALADFLSELPEIIPTTEGEGESLTVTGFDFEIYKSIVDLYTGRLSRVKPVRHLMGLGLSEASSLALYESIVNILQNDMTGKQVHVMQQESDPDSWEYLYSAESEFYSCMEGSEGVRAYANNEGVTLYYTTEDGERFTGQKLTGRCIVNTVNKTFGRVYGESGLKGYLISKGFQQVRDVLEGVKVNLERYESECNHYRQAWLMPYIDNSGGVGFNDQGELVFAYGDRQLLECTTTDGYRILNLHRNCSHCKRELSLRHRVYTCSSDESLHVCEGCFDRHYFYSEGKLRSISGKSFALHYNKAFKSKELIEITGEHDHVQLAAPEMHYSYLHDRNLTVTHITRDAILSGMYELLTCRITGGALTENGINETLSHHVYGDNRFISNAVSGALAMLDRVGVRAFDGSRNTVLVGDLVQDSMGYKRYFLDYVQEELFAD